MKDTLQPVSAVKTVYSNRTEEKFQRQFLITGANAGFSQLLGVPKPQHKDYNEAVSKIIGQALAPMPYNRSPPA